MGRTPLAVVLVCVLTMVCAPLAHADVFGSLSTGEPGASGQYLVKFAAGTSEAEQAAALSDAGVQDLSYVAPLRLHSVVLPEDAQAALDQLSANASVERVEAEQTREASAVPNDPAFDSQWSLARIGWDQLYGSLVPSGSATVAVLDTGVDAGHADLAANVVPGTSILDPGSNGASDSNGHGTQMAGIVAASTDNGEGMAGIGYAGVNVMPVTVLDAQGVGQDGDIINGVIWAADHGADVILMSFSSPDFSPSLQDAIDYAWSQGAVLVGAAGNDGSSAAHFPAGDRGVVGVANTDESDVLSASSNYGDAAFMAAPGSGIYTTANGGGYTSISGTSASAAAVAGAAALLRANSPGLSNGVVVGRLARSADPPVSGGTGNGRLNLARAAADDSTEAVQPSGAAPVGEGGPFIGPYAAQAATLNSATLNGAATVTVKGGTSIIAAVNGTSAGGAGGSNAWRGTRWRIDTTPPPPSTCANTTDVTGNNTATNSFSITAPAAEGTYNAYFIGYSDNGCSADATNTITLTNGVVVDNTPPTVLSIDRVGSSPTNASSVSWTVTFSESVSGVGTADFALASSGLGGSPGITGVTGSGATRTVTATTGSGNGTLGLNLVDDDSIADVATNVLGGSGNGNGNFTGQLYTLDRTAPTVSSIDRADANPTNASSVNWTVTFSEPVTGVDASDFALANSGLGGTPAITNVTGSGATRTVTATTGSGNGTLGLNLVDDDSIADVATNVLGGSGNGNGNFTGQLYTLDRTAPTVSVEQAAGQADPTNDQPIRFTADFSEPVSGFTPADVTLSGSSGHGSAVVTLTPGPDDTYEIAVTGLDSDGTLTASIDADRVSDPAGNGNTASTSTDNTVTFDATNPDVTVEQKLTQDDPTNTQPIEFTATFTEPVTGFDNTDVVLGGTAGSGSATVTVTGGGDTYNIAVSGLDADGTLTAEIGVNAAEDAAQNGNDASTSTDNQVLYDATAPEPTLSAPPAFTNDDTPEIAGTAGTQGADSTHSADDGHVTVKVFQGATLLQTHSNVLVDSGDGSFSVDATHLDDGEYTALVEQSDAAGNGGSDSRDFEVDTVRPDVTVNQALTQADPTNDQPIHFTAVFTESVTGFDENDVTLSGTAGTGSATVVVTGSGDTYDVAVSGISSDGTVTADVDENGAEDDAGNGNTASTSTDNTVEFDATNPDVTVEQKSTQDDPTDTQPIEFTATFTEPVTGFDNTDVVLGGTAGSGSATVTVTGGGATYNIAVSGLDADGTLTAEIGVNAAEDAAQNGNDASTSTDNQVTYDNTDPESEASSPAFSNASALTIPVDYAASDNLSGLDEVELWAKKDSGPWELADTDPSPGISGQFNYTPSPGDGTYRFYTIAIDNAGNREAIPTEVDAVTVKADSTTLRDTAAPDPTLTDPPTLTNDDTPAIAGTAGTQAEDGSHSADDGHVTVKVFEGATLLQTHSNVTVDGGGGFTVDATHLDDGEYTARVDQSDAAGNSDFDERDFEVDATAPDLTVEQAAGQDDPTNTQPIHFTATFTEPVDDFDENDVTLGGTAGLGSATVVVTGSSDTYDIAVSGITSNGTVTADVAADSAEDAAGNGNTVSTSTDNTVTYDGTDPAVTVEQAGTQDDPTNAQPINFTATFTEPVDGFDEDDVTLGGTAGVGSATVTVTGGGDTYNIAVSGISSDGTVTADVPADSAEDSAGNGNTASTSTDNTVTLDTEAPEVESIDRADPNPTNASSVSWTVTFSEPVSGVDASDFALANSGLGGTPAITNVTGSGATRTVTASTGSGSGTLGLNLVDDDSIADPATNSLGGTGLSGGNDGSFTGEVYTVDRGAPTVSSIDRADANPTNASSVSWTVTFSEPVSGVDASDFALANSGLGGAPAITNVTGSGATRTVTASTGSGSGTLGLNLVDDDSIEDDATNTLAGGFTGEVYTIDRDAPTVSSINRADANPTSAASVNWTVTFSESVTGVDAADFALSNSGLGGAPAITNVTGSGATRTVTASTGTGSGTLGLNLVDDDSIADGVGNKLGGTGTGNGDFTGQVYTVDHAPPPTFAFTGFLRPIDNLPTVNQVKAGSAVPIKFGLGGNKGMNIFWPGYPISQVTLCNSTAPVDGIEEIDTPGSSGLSYDAGTQTYHYVWKTDKSWTNCRQLVIKFSDGSYARANFKFSK